MSILSDMMHRKLTAIGFMYNQKDNVYVVGNLYAKVYVPAYGGSEIVVEWGTIKKTITRKQYILESRHMVKGSAALSHEIRQAIREYDIQGKIRAEKLMKLGKEQREPTRRWKLKSIVLLLVRFFKCSK